MNPGGFNHPITVQREVQIGTRALGEPNKVWQTFKEAFAEVSTRRGREHWDPTTSSRISEVVWHFRCHYYDVEGIDSSMQIVDESDQTFQIKSLLPDVESREDIIIECTLLDGRVGSAPLMGFVTDEIADGAAGQPYAGFTIQAKGGTAPYIFSVTSGALPTGLSLNSSTGAISGTPTAAGVYSPVVTVTDSAGDTHVLPAIEITVA